MMHQLPAAEDLDQARAEAVYMDLGLRGKQLAQAWYGMEWGIAAQDPDRCTAALFALTGQLTNAMLRASDATPYVFDGGSVAAHLGTIAAPLLLERARREAPSISSVQEYGSQLGKLGEAIFCRLPAHEERTNTHRKIIDTVGTLVTIQTLDNKNAIAYPGSSREKRGVCRPGRVLFAHDVAIIETLSTGNVQKLPIITERREKQTPDIHAHSLSLPFSDMVRRAHLRTEGAFLGAGQSLRIVSRAVRGQKLDDDGAAMLIALQEEYSQAIARYKRRKRLE